MNVQFAASTWLWTSPFSSDAVSLFSKIRKIGFDAVEIAVEDPALIDTGILNRALKDNDIKPIICGAFGPTRDLTNEDPAIHKNCFNYIEQCFDICEAVGARFVAGPMYSAVGKARLVPPEQRKKEWGLAVTNLRKVCESAQKRGLSIALEALNRFETDLINNSEDLMKLINDINHPAARVLIDSFHMTIEEKNLADAVKTVGDRLIHVQFSENHRGIPGTGMTNWNDLKAGLEAVGYNEVVSIESFTPNVQELAGAVCIWKPFAPTQDIFAEEGLKFLKQWAK
jgi:D-psicose/D-tagatose/L-ribulose 3-epimerase